LDKVFGRIYFLKARDNESSLRKLLLLEEIRKATVFPVPFFALARTSFPARMIGIASS
jgi:hypothetical protein